MLQTIRRIGEHNVAAVVSDSTIVTLQARANIRKEIPTILDLRDSAHHLHLIIKDITKLEEFKKVPPRTCSSSMFLVNPVV